MIDKSYLTAQGFFEEAEQLRAAIDQHFGEPNKHGQSHQVWNYWNVPSTYTYLRTNPEKIIPRELVERFVKRLADWSAETLGLTKVYWPYLSLYVAGCLQGLHNDATNGRFGYVYSLTRWDERTFLGGETLLFREDRYFQSPRITQADASIGFYELIPARFNQLLVFDDRIPHAVPRLEGTMDPFQGRLVMHSHLAEEGISVSGTLTKEQAVPLVEQVLRDGIADLELYRKTHSGLLTVRVDVDENGSSTITPLMNRLMPTVTDAPPRERFLDSVIEALSNVTYPHATGPSKIIVPVALYPSAP